jgi:hypothetical protein
MLCLQAKSPSRKARSVSPEDDVDLERSRRISSMFSPSTLSPAPRNTKHRSKKDRTTASPGAIAALIAGLGDDDDDVDASVVRDENQVGSNADCTNNSALNAATGPTTCVDIEQSPYIAANNASATALDQSATAFSSAGTPAAATADSRRQSGATVTPSALADFANDLSNLSGAAEFVAVQSLSVAASAPATPASQVFEDADVAVPQSSNADASAESQLYGLLQPSDMSKLVRTPEVNSLKTASAAPSSAGLPLSRSDIFASSMVSAVNGNIASIGFAANNDRILSALQSSAIGMSASAVHPSASEALAFGSSFGFVSTAGPAHRMRTPGKGILTHTKQPNAAAYSNANTASAAGGAGFLADSVADASAVDLDVTASRTAGKRSLHRSVVFVSPETAEYNGEAPPSASIRRIERDSARKIIRASTGLHGQDMNATDISESVVVASTSLPVLPAEDSADEMSAEEGRESVSSLESLTTAQNSSILAEWEAEADNTLESNAVQQKRARLVRSAKRQPHISQSASPKRRQARVASDRRATLAVHRTRISEADDDSDDDVSEDNRGTVPSDNASGSGQKWQSENIGAAAATAESPAVVDLASQFGTADVSSSSASKTTSTMDVDATAFASALTFDSGMDTSNNVGATDDDATAATNMSAHLHTAEVSASLTAAAGARTKRRGVSMGVLTQKQGGAKAAQAAGNFKFARRATLATANVSEAASEDNTDSPVSDELVESPGTTPEEEAAQIVGGDIDVSMTSNASSGAPRTHMHISAADFAGLSALGATNITADRTANMEDVAAMFNSMVSHADMTGLAMDVAAALPMNAADHSNAGDANDDDVDMDVTETLPIQPRHAVFSEAPMALSDLDPASTASTASTPYQHVQSPAAGQPVSMSLAASTPVTNLGSSAVGQATPTVALHSNLKRLIREFSASKGATVFSPDSFTPTAGTVMNNISARDQDRSRSDNVEGDVMADTTTQFAPSLMHLLQGERLNATDSATEVSHAATPMQHQSAGVGAATPIHRGATPVAAVDESFLTPLPRAFDNVGAAAEPALRLWSRHFQRACGRTFPHRCRVCWRSCQRPHG